MSVALSRKRSRLGVDEDDDEVQRRREPSPAFSDTLKRSKTQCELEELDIIGVEDAWSVDLDAILASKRIARPVGGRMEAHDNWKRYKREESIVVLCVQGNVQVHYELLWYEASTLCYEPLLIDSQLDITRPLRHLALTTSSRTLPRSVHTQASVERTVLASHITGCRAVKQPLRAPGVTASTRRRKVPTGRTGSARSACAAEASIAVWLGCWQTRWDASWSGHTNALDGTVTELHRDPGARTAGQGVGQVENR